MGEKFEVNDEQFNKIKKLYEEDGLCPREISEKVNISPNIIRRLIVERRLLKKDKFAHITKEILETLYIKEHKNIREIATRLKVGQQTVSKRLKEYRIKINHVGSEPLNIKEADLLQMYVVDGMTTPAIAKFYNCSVSVLTKYFKKYKIKTRSKQAVILKDELELLYNKQHMSASKIAEKLGYNLTTINEYLILYNLKNANNYIKISYDKLKECSEQGLSVKEMANKFNCSSHTIGRNLKRFKIETQKSTLQNVTYEELYKPLIEERKELKEIAVLYNISISTVKDKLRELGINIIKDRQAHITEELLKDLYYNKKMKQQEIADYLKTSRSAIAKKFKEYGIKKIRKIDMLTEEVLRDMYVKQNIPQCLIAEKFGLDTHAVLRKIKIFHLEEEKTDEQRAQCRAKAYEKALNNSRSKAEKELQELFPTPFNNIHTIINLELDLWYPEQQVAIEYNGDYWHSTKFPRNSGLHLAKQSLCNNKGIHLINIFERDWKNKKLKDKIIIHLKKILNPESLKTVEGTITEDYNYKRKQFEHKYNFLKENTEGNTIGIINENKEFIATLSYTIRDGACFIDKYTAHPDHKEDYTTLINKLKEKYSLPIIVRTDNRYYNRFPAEVKPRSIKKIKPEIVYVLKNKAKRECEATEEFKSNPRCFEVYDCGFMEYTF